MGAPLMLPRPLRRPIALGVTNALRRSGRLLTPVARRLPVGPVAGQLLTHSGFLLPTAHPAWVRRAVKEFLTTPVHWYMHLSRAAAEHPRMSLRSIRAPTTFVAGKHDLLASAHDIAAAAVRIPDAEYVVLPGSHFVQLEHPDAVHLELLRLVERVR